MWDQDHSSLALFSSYVCSCSSAYQRQEAANAPPPSSPKNLGAHANDAALQKAVEAAQAAIAKGDKDALAKLLDQNEKLLTCVLFALFGILEVLCVCPKV